MNRTYQPDTPLTEILQGAPTCAAEAAARAMGISAGQLHTTKLGGISADQLRAICVALDLSADAVLCTGTSQISKDEARLLHAYRVTDERGRKSMRTAAEFASQWREGHTLRIIDGGRA